MAPGAGGPSAPHPVGEPGLLGALLPASAPRSAGALQSVSVGGGAAPSVAACFGAGGPGLRGR
eukprot:8406498-Alexandrium_andersonii.AAC.1